VAVPHDAHETSNEAFVPSNASNEPASLNAPVLDDDLVRWTDQFFEIFGPTLSEFEPLE
jgi:hypothetical protein